MSTTTAAKIKAIQKRLSELEITPRKTKYVIGVDVADNPELVRAIKSISEKLDAWEEWRRNQPKSFFSTPVWKNEGDERTKLYLKLRDDYTISNIAGKLYDLGIRAEQL